MGAICAFISAYEAMDLGQCGGDVYARARIVGHGLSLLVGYAVLSLVIAISGLLCVLSSTLEMLTG